MIQITQAIVAAARQIDTESGASDLTRKILEYPLRIREQQSIVRTAKTNLDAAKTNMAMEESTLISEISSEQNPDTLKPKYSNAEARQAELKKRMNESNDYKMVAMTNGEAEEVFFNASYDLQQLEGEFKAHCTAGEILAARLKFMGS
jgi:predicted RNase H-like nuclease (RuvC/YqgF family)